MTHIIPEKASATSARVWQVDHWRVRQKRLTTCAVSKLISFSKLHTDSQRGLVLACVSVCAHLPQPVLGPVSNEDSLAVPLLNAPARLLPLPSPLPSACTAGHHCLVAKRLRVYEFVICAVETPRVRAAADIGGPQYLLLAEVVMRVFLAA